MRDPIDTLALTDALSPAERAEVEAALADRPALAEAFARWRSLRAEVRAELARDLPDRAVLVLYALADDDLLSDDERDRLDAARPALDAALARHPGLAAAVRRVRADREAFERAWAEAAQGATDIPAEPARAAAPVKAPHRAADRPAATAARRPTRWAWRTAALAAIVAFAAVLTSIYLRDAGWETVTASGEQTLTFADGSTVVLEDGARLMIPEGGSDDSRQARLLAGRALFEIVRDLADPFEVTTPNAEVTVLGTTFSVRATDVETEVVLASGVVTLAPRATPEAAVRLAPGERATVLALDAPSAPERADLDAALAWAGMVYARDLTLEQLAEKLGRLYETVVTIDPALAGEPVSDGVYGRNGLRDALDKLAATLSGRVVQEGDGFRIVAE